MYQAQQRYFLCLPSERSISSHSTWGDFYIAYHHITAKVFYVRHAEQLSSFY